jgi:hypothetical protein
MGLDDHSPRIFPLHDIVGDGDTVACTCPAGSKCEHPGRAS